MFDGVFVHTRPERSFEVEVVAGALRAAAQGHRVLVAQFLKGGIEQGSDKPRRFVERLVWLRPAIARIIDSAPTPEEHSAIESLWQWVEQETIHRDVVILDEVGLAIQFGLVKEEQLLRLLGSRRAGQGITLTGPLIPLAIAEWADSWTSLRTRSALTISS